MIFILVTAYLTFVSTEINTVIFQKKNQEAINNTFLMLENNPYYEQNQLLLPLLNRNNLTSKQKSLLYNAITKNLYFQNNNEDFLLYIGHALYYNEITENTEEAIYLYSLLAQIYFEMGADSFANDMINTALGLKNFFEIENPIIRAQALTTYGKYLLNYNDINTALKAEAQLEKDAEIIPTNNSNYLRNAFALKAYILLKQGKSKEAFELAERTYKKYYNPNEDLTHDSVYCFILPVLKVKAIYSLQNNNYKQALQLNKEYGSIAEKYKFILKKAMLSKELLIKLPDSMIKEKNILLEELSIDAESLVSFFLENFSVISKDQLNNVIQNLRYTHEKEIIGIRIFKITVVNIGLIYIFILLVYIIYNETQIDGLTMLKNRRALNKRLKKYKAKNKTYSSIMIDLDSFKNLNDTYGHDFGDEVLIGVADLLLKYEKKTIRCYRYGGEELVFILDHFDFDHVIRFSEHIRNEISILKWRYNIHVTASLGIGFESQNSIKEADENMYIAKRKGKNFTAFRKDGKQYLAERRLDIRNEIPDTQE